MLEVFDSIEKADADGSFLHPFGSVILSIALGSSITHISNALKAGYKPDLNELLDSPPKLGKNAMINAAKVTMWTQLIKIAIKRERKGHDKPN